MGKRISAGLLSLLVGERLSRANRRADWNFYDIPGRRSPSGIAQSDQLCYPQAGSSTASWLERSHDHDMLQAACWRRRRIGLCAGALIAKLTSS